MQRTPSTHPSWLLGVPSPEPDIAARAALSASASSHFPCPGRLLCILAGESASRTGIPSDARCLVRPPRRTTSPPSRCRPAPRPRRSPRRAPRSPPRRRGTGGTGPCGPSSPGRTASASRRGCRPRRRPARGRRVSIRFACLAPFFPCSPGPGRRHTDGAR